MSRRITIAIAIVIFPFFALSQHNGHSGEGNLNPKNDWPHPVMDTENYSLWLLENLEYSEKDKSAVWDFTGWYGGDYNRLWIKSEGERLTSSPQITNFDFQLLYGKLVSPYFDVQAGVRFFQTENAIEKESKYSAVLGLQGLSLYYFEIDSAFFISENGKVLARFNASEDFLLTQRLITQIKFETNGAFQRLPELGIESGVNDASIGLRLRYEIRRELAPYIGVTKEFLLGETATRAKVLNLETSETKFVTGLRFWY